MPFYAVGIGRKPGVYKTWAECQQQIKGFSCAKYRKFPTEVEANGFIAQFSPQNERKSETSRGQSGINGNRAASKEPEVASTMDDNAPPVPHASISTPPPQPTTQNIQPNTDSRVSSKRLLTVKSNFINVKSHICDLRDTVAKFEEKFDDINKVKDGSSKLKVSSKMVSSLLDLTHEIEINTNSILHSNSQVDEQLKKLLETKKRKPEDSSDSTEQPAAKRIASERNPPLGGDEPVIVYTDGCCLNNGQPGARAGIGVYWGPNHPLNVAARLKESRQTNNCAEIHAACKAIEQAAEQGIQNLIIHTDSKFMMNSINDWIHKWKRKGWKTATGAPVKNIDDFKKLDHLISAGPVKVDWVHVRGHQGIEGNEAADQLANTGARLPFD